MARQSDLMVITKAKELCGYIMTVTQKSPKQFRFSLVSRLQGYALDIVASLYRANEVYLSGPDVAVKARVRLDYQHEALTSAKLLGYVAQLSIKQRSCSKTQNLLQPLFSSRFCARFEVKGSLSSGNHGFSPHIGTSIRPLPAVMFFGWALIQFFTP